jgi:predicted aspartyl protease
MEHPMARSRNARGETALDVARRTGKVADLMAAEMIDFTATKGDCTETDLLDAGFTAGELAMHRFDARKLAEQRFTRQAA